MSARGYAAIGLHQSIDWANVGGAMRAAHVYGAALVVLASTRVRKGSTDTTKAWRHVPLLQVDPAVGVLSACPYDCVPVAVELSDRARSLVTFEHPERAFYVFGPENGSIPDQALNRCKHVVYVPTRFCMNLAATVNVVLYDRLAKRAEQSEAA